MTRLALLTVAAGATLCGAGILATAGVVVVGARAGRMARDWMTS